MRRHSPPHPGLHPWTGPSLPWASGASGQDGRVPVLPGPALLGGGKLGDFLVDAVLVPVRCGGDVVAAFEQSSMVPGADLLDCHTEPFLEVDGVRDMPAVQAVHRWHAWMEGCGFGTVNCFVEGIPE